MSIYIPSKTEYETLAPGAYGAVVIEAIDIGTQSGPFGPKPQVILGFETTDEVRADGQPFVLRQFYTLSGDSRAKLRQHLDGWIGPLSSDDFGRLDLATLLGRSCTISVIHKLGEDGRTKASVGGIMRPPKGAPEYPTPHNGLVAFSLSARPFDRAGYLAVRDWIKVIIAKSPEYHAAIASGSAGSSSAANDASKSTADRVRKHLQQRPGTVVGAGHDRSETIGEPAPIEPEVPDDDIPW
jgi:hypothetical protein